MSVLLDLMRDAVIATDEIGPDRKEHRAITIDLSLPSKSESVMTARVSWIRDCRPQTREVPIEDLGGLLRRISIGWEFVDGAVIK